MIIFLDILKTDSVRHAGEVLKTIMGMGENSENAQGLRWSLQ